MYYISPHDLKRWKENSIEVARDLGLLDGSVLDLLEENIELKLNKENRPKGLWYGRIIYKLPKENSTVEVFEQNAFMCIPAYLREITNQSGMDHELIGHAGHYISEKPYGETVACMVQERMAKRRGEENVGWEIVSKLIPVVQKHHKKVALSSYRQPL